MNLNENNLMNLLPLLMYNSNISSIQNNANQLNNTPQQGNNLYAQYQDQINKLKILEMLYGQNTYSSSSIQSQYAKLVNPSLNFQAPFDMQQNNIKNDNIVHDIDNFKGMKELENSMRNGIKNEDFSSSSISIPMSANDKTKKYPNEFNNRELFEKPKYFSCDECDKIFPKEANLVDHIRIHTGEKPFRCLFDNCGKSFSQLGNLKKHESIHFGEKAFYCEYEGCGKGFSALYNLKIHQRSHLGERPYKCRIEGCGRDFYDKGNLKYHEKTSHSYEMKTFPFSCDHLGCNLKFKTKKQKMLHHHNLEPDCKLEKNSIMKTMSFYKKFVHSLIESCEIKKEQFENSNVYLELKKSYEDLEKILFDTDYFYMTLGEKFEELPK